MIVFCVRLCRGSVRWRVNFNLFPATDRLEAAFGLETTFRLVTTAVVTLVTDELEDANGELSPMSPWNHVQSLA